MTRLVYSLLVVAASFGCGAARPSSSTSNETAYAARAMAAPAAAASIPAKMRVHFIDVGQGAATLFEFPHHAVLVDTGGESNGAFDSTAQLEAYLNAFFAQRPDLHNQLASLILTHPHIDHTRGVKTVLQDFHPQNIVTDGLTHGSGVAQQMLAQQYAATHESDTPPVGFRAVHENAIPGAGLHDSVIDPVDEVGVDPVITVLWGQVMSDPGWGSDHGKRRFDDENNHSVVVRVDYGQASVLITGDLEEVAIADMVKRYQAHPELLDADVYEAGHHGSRNGTIQELVDKVTPEYAVLCCGPADRQVEWSAWAYGHPSGLVVDMLATAITTMRAPIDVQVGRSKYTFDDRNVARAIYATGWDGTIVLEAGADGLFRVVSPGAAPALVNLNTATEAELEALPRIGATKAQAIVADRAAHGPYAKVDDLTRVHGISAATVEAIRGLVTVGA